MRWNAILWKVEKSESINLDAVGVLGFRRGGEGVYRMEGAARLLDPCGIDSRTASGFFFQNELQCWALYEVARTGRRCREEKE